MQCLSRHPAHLPQPPGRPACRRGKQHRFAAFLKYACEQSDDRRLSCSRTARQDRKGFRERHDHGVHLFFSQLKSLSFCDGVDSFHRFFLCHFLFTGQRCFGKLPNSLRNGALYRGDVLQGDKLLSRIGRLRRGAQDTVFHKRSGRDRPFSLFFAIVTQFMRADNLTLFN